MLDLKPASVCALVFGVSLPAFICLSITRIGQNTCISGYTYIESGGMALIGRNINQSYTPLMIRSIHE